MANKKIAFSYFLRRAAARYKNGCYFFVSTVQPKRSLWLTLSWTRVTNDCLAYKSAYNCSVIESKYADALANSDKKRATAGGVFRIANKHLYQ